MTRSNNGGVRKRKRKTGARVDIRTLSALSLQRGRPAVEKKEWESRYSRFGNPDHGVKRRRKRKKEQIKQTSRL